MQLCFLLKGGICGVLNADGFVINTHTLKYFEFSIWPSSPEIWEVKTKTMSDLEAQK